VAEEKRGRMGGLGVGREGAEEGVVAKGTAKFFSDADERVGERERERGAFRRIELTRSPRAVYARCPSKPQTVGG